MQDISHARTLNSTPPGQDLPRTFHPVKKAHHHPHSRCLRPRGTTHLTGNMQLTLLHRGTPLTPPGSCLQPEPAQRPPQTTSKGAAPGGSPPPQGLPPGAPPLSPPSSHHWENCTPAPANPLCSLHPATRAQITQPDRMPRPHCKAPTRNWNGARGTGLRYLPRHPLPSRSQGNHSSSS